jgi:hypothetical protein
MPRYNFEWNGPDASGNEQGWDNPVWFETLRIASKFLSQGYSDHTSPFYLELQESLPSVAWLDENGRSFFRDYSRPWRLTGVLDISSDRVEITTLGKKVVNGEIPTFEVFRNLFQQHAENQERPFRIICQALDEAGRALSIDEIIRSVMRAYRP